MVVEQLRRRVRNAQEQASVERLRNGVLSALSHDLRTPLTAIVGASAALCDEGLEPRERWSFAQMVATEAVRLDSAGGRLLELARLESQPASGVRSSQAIEEVIGTALHRLARQLEARRVVTDVPEEIPLAEFDPVLIEQVVVNLVENAIRYAGTSPIRDFPPAGNAARSVSKSPTAGRVSDGAKKSGYSKSSTAARRAAAATAAPAWASPSAERLWRRIAAGLALRTAPGAARSYALRSLPEGTRFPLRRPPPA